MKLVHHFKILAIIIALSIIQPVCAATFSVDIPGDGVPPEDELIFSDGFEDTP